MGIYIKKLEAHGPGKTPAELILDRGLNVLSGASDTGKSYVFECIDFIFGSKENPKDVEEAAGYNEIRVELHSYEGKVWSLSRNFGDPKIYVVAAPLEDFSKHEQRKLSVKHDSKKDDNLSAFLLDILGLKGKKLKKNARNETEILSFRNCARFSLISENKIITKESPIYSGQVIDKTVDEALFRLLLTGKDDDELEEIEDEKIAKSMIRGKIDFIHNLVEEKRVLLMKLKDEIKNIGQEEINIQIDELTKQVNEANKSVLKEEENRQKIWSDINVVSSEIKHTSELLKRFNLLKEHYISDLKRLEFINEGKQYLDQLVDKPCPICGKIIEELEEDCLADIQSFEASIQSEHSKIHKKIIDLEKTITELREDETEKKSKLDTLHSNFNLIDKYIISKLKPVYDVNTDKLKSYLLLKNTQSHIDKIAEETFNLLNQKKYYEEKLTEKIQKAESILLSQDIYEGLSLKIKDIINGWGLKCETVYYNRSINDIEIDGKARGNFGKGYRAIYLSAFMIGVMVYCREKGLKHPFFLVLDSPLISFKERDADPEDEKLPTEIKDTFYRYLADLNNVTTMQIFVIENKEQPEDINSKATIEHYTKNEKTGRYGFYPI